MPSLDEASSLEDVASLAATTIDDAGKGGVVVRDGQHVLSLERRAPGPEEGAFVVDMF